MSFQKVQVSFPSNFTSIFSDIKHNSSVLFWLKHYIIQPIKGQTFEIFEYFWSRFVKLLLPISNWAVNSSSTFESFFIVMTHNSPVTFKLLHFLLWTKRCHQSLDFETFKSSGKNLPNSSCHYCKYKPVFLQSCINLECH